MSGMKKLLDHLFPVQSHRSWSFGADIPTATQFAAQIGRAAGFDPSESQVPRSVLEDEWRDWWNNLLIRHAEGTDRLQRAWAASPGTYHRVFSDAAAAGHVLFDPPAFDALTARTLLREHCRRVWREVQPALDGERHRLVERLLVQWHGLRLDEAVAECARAKGKREAAPFTLNVLIVPWPEQYLREVHDHTLVLGAAYLEPERLLDLRHLLLTYLKRMV